VRVFVEGTGWAVSNLFFEHIFRIDSVSPASGSVAGGTLLTVTGAGLTSAASMPAVWVGGAACDVVGRAWGELTCRTRPPTSGALVEAPLQVRA
jgi:hypothetical protein